MRRLQNELESWGSPSSYPFSWGQKDSRGCPEITLLARVQQRLTCSQLDSCSQLAGTRKLIVRGALAGVVPAQGKWRQVDQWTHGACGPASLPYSVSPPGQRETSPQRIRVGDSSSKTPNVVLRPPQEPVCAHTCVNTHDIHTHEDF